VPGALRSHNLRKHPDKLTEQQKVYRDKMLKRDRERAARKRQQQRERADPPQQYNEDVRWQDGES